MDKLDELFTLQEKLSKGWFEKLKLGQHPFDAWPELLSMATIPKDTKIIKWILEYCRALTHEVIEVEDACKYKFWDKDKEVDVADVRREIVDCWHFLIDISMAAGMDSNEVLRIYKLKNDVNIKRLESGTYSTNDKKSQEADDSHVM